jgi:hypothetical protein
MKTAREFAMSAYSRWVDLETERMRAAGAPGTDLPLMSGAQLEIFVEAIQEAMDSVLANTKWGIEARGEVGK